jgi:hypothetical protein
LILLEWRWRWRRRRRWRWRRHVIIRPCIGTEKKRA